MAPGTPGWPAARRTPTWTWSDAVALTATDLTHLRGHAMEALERVLGPGSELPDLWEDSEDADAWREDIQRLRAALS